MRGVGGRRPVGLLLICVEGRSGSALTSSPFEMLKEGEGQGRDSEGCGLVDSKLEGRALPLRVLEKDEEDCMVVVKL